MCTTAIYGAISAISAIGSAYGAKRNNDKQADRQRIAFDINQKEKQQDFESQQGFNRQSFQAIKDDAQRSKERDQLREQAAETAIADPLAQIQNSSEQFSENVAERQKVLDSDLETSLNNGGQDVGSGVQGQVSNVFLNASNDAKARNVDKAQQSNKLNSAILGVGDLQRSNIGSITTAGQQANTLSAQASRQKQIDDYLKSLALNKATLDNTKRPNDVVVL